ncbi:MAG: hypothetical protein SGI92_11260 [Bryobacteraceae bacterium]|nr:hypothetical protein [Bryobacteraceae bacterium]
MISNAFRAVHAWLLLAAIILAAPLASAQYGIRTYAGGGPDNLPAISANVGAPYGVAVDAAGNIYASAYLRHQVFKITPGGTITVFAGNGQYGFYGDGGAAKNAALSYPQGIALDSAGNLYIADSNNNRVRKVDGNTGVITTVVGGGASLIGDGGIATAAQLGHPSNIIFESDGTMYVSDTANARVRRVDPVTNIITTYAGGGSSFCCGGGLGDGQQANNSKMYGPEGLALDSSNNLYIADPSYGRIRKVTKATGVITTVAGSGLGANSGDNGPATSAILLNPVGVAIDSNGDLYIGVTQYIRKVSGGTITRVAGAGGTYPDLYGIPLTDAQIGNGGNAISAILTKPSQLTLHPSGGIVFADSDLGRIRKLSGATMQGVAGTGWFAYSGDGFAANRASLYQAMDLTFDSNGDLLIADNGNNSIRRVNSATGIIDTIAGNGLSGATSANNLGEGGPLSSARINSPRGIDYRSGRLTITDPNNYRVRQSASGVINKIAGTGYSASVSGGGDGNATAVGLYGVYGTVSDPHGNVFITDGDRVRAIANGKIVTIAGSVCGSSGDGGPAISARLCAVQGIARDSSGALYIADSGFHKIRKITGLPGSLLDETGCGSCVINTIAGTGSNGFSGDGGAATSAALFNPPGCGRRRRRQRLYRRHRQQPDS